MSRDIGDFYGVSPMDCRVLQVYLEAGILPRVDEGLLVAMVEDVPVARVALAEDEGGNESWR
ncbi:MAG: hypothetical protein LKE51_09480 [Selenomonas sp.]|jgi:hypothetical protein|nr:hypothetical protein [Selenomonas sp.]